MTRDEALGLPHAETMLNGRCVGVLEWDKRWGTTLVVRWCECAGGVHEMPSIGVFARAVEVAAVVPGQGMLL